MRSPGCWGCAEGPGAQGAPALRPRGGPLTLSQAVSYGDKIGPQPGPCSGCFRVPLAWVPHLAVLMSSQLGLHSEEGGRRRWRKEEGRERRRRRQWEQPLVCEATSRPLQGPALLLSSLRIPPRQQERAGCWATPPPLHRQCPPHLPIFPLPRLWLLPGGVSAVRLAANPPGVAAPVAGR